MQHCFLFYLESDSSPGKALCRTVLFVLHYVNSLSVESLKWNIEDDVMILKRLGLQLWTVFEFFSFLFKSFVKAGLYINFLTD